jgi:hypothetical protein
MLLALGMHGSTAAIVIGAILLHGGLAAVLGWYLWVYKDREPPLR